MSRLQTLEAIEAAVWAELARAPRDKESAWRVGVLGTTDGKKGDARCIVLREVDPAGRRLKFYTDSRASKVRQLERHPDATIVLWSAPLAWQLRLRVDLTIETSGLVVSSLWARLKMTPAAHDYLSPLPPGSTIPNPVPDRDSREHFGVITAHIRALDWTELHADGHRRALFDAQGRRWLVP